MSRFSRRLTSILGSSTPWLFLLGALGVGLLGEGASKLVDAWLTGSEVGNGWATFFLGVLCLLGGVVGFNLPRRLRDLFDRPIGASLSESEQVARHKGLVMLVSRGEYVPAGDALYYHSWHKVPGARSPLQAACLLTGPDDDGEQSSQSNGRHLKETYRAEGVQMELWPLESANDVSEIFQLATTTLQVLQDKYKLDPSEIIVDYTGGTKTMTVGLILAALSAGIKLQYMKPNRYLPDGRADKAAGSTPRLVTPDFAATISVNQE